VAATAWQTPRQGIAAECQRRGTNAVISGCIDVLDGGDDVDNAFTGPPSRTRIAQGAIKVPPLS
jgi:hypothetical protein